MSALWVPFLAVLSAINVAFYVGGDHHWWSAASAVFCGILALRVRA